MKYFIDSCVQDKVDEAISGEKIIRMFEAGELSRFQKTRLRQAFKKADKIWGSEKKKTQSMGLR